MNAPRLSAFLLSLAPWALLTLAVNALFAGDIVRQLRLLDAPSVPGTVLSSALESDDVPDERHHGVQVRHGLQVRYAYRVDGVPFVGERYRTHPWRTNDEGAMRALVDRLAPGTTVRVSYLEGAPGDAVLLRGLEGADVLLLLGVAGLVLLCSLGGYALVYLARGPEAHVAAVTRQGRVHITLTEMYPAVVGWCVMAALACGLYFVIGVLTDLYPSLTTALGCWALVLGAGTFFTWRTDARMRTGQQDVIFDAHARRLSLPPMTNDLGIVERPGRLELDWSRVRDIILVRRTREDSEGHVTTLHRPTVCFVDDAGALQQEPVLEWQKEARATALVGWLQSRLDRAPSGRAS